MKHFCIGAARVDVLRNLIDVNGDETRIEPRVMKTLVRLTESAGQVVTRDDLLVHAWDGAFVSDEALTKAVSQLRKALGDTNRTARIIETVPKVGYRLATPVIPAQDIRPVPHQLGHVIPPKHHPHVPWLWGAVAALTLAVVGQWEPASLSDSVGQTNAMERRVVHIPDAAKPDFISTLGLTDSTLSGAKMIKIVKLKCSENTGEIASDIKGYMNVSGDACEEGSGVLEGSFTVLKGDASAARLGSLIADALR